MDFALSLPELFEALVLAADKHRYQRRSGFDRLPYINHLLKVTDTLIRVGGETDRELLLAALLHDIVEDTEVTVEDLSRQFSSSVGQIVGELTDDMQLPYRERKRRQVENAENLSVEARKIRIADKGNNILDVLAYPIRWPPEKKKYYVTHSLEVVDRIRGVNARLEQWFDEVVAEARRELHIKNP